MDEYKVGSISPETTYPRHDEQSQKTNTNSDHVSDGFGSEKQIGDCKINNYGKNEEEKFDAVLTAMYKVIDSLNDAIDDDQLFSSDVATFDQTKPALSINGGARFISNRLMSAGSSGRADRAAAGADSKQQVGGEAADKETFAGKTKNNKLDAFKSRVEPKENKDFFAEDDSRLISDFESNKSRLKAEDELEKSSDAIENDPSNLKKQMTHVQLPLKYFESFIKMSPNSIISLERKQGFSDERCIKRDDIKTEAVQIAESQSSNSSLSINSEFEVELAKEKIATCSTDDVFVNNLSMPIRTARRTSPPFTIFPELQMHLEGQTSRKKKQDAGFEQVSCEIGKGSKLKGVLSRNYEKSKKSDSVFLRPCDIEETERDNQSFKPNTNRLTKKLTKSTLSRQKAFLMKQRKFLRGFSRSQGSNEVESQKNKKADKNLKSFDEKYSTRKSRGSVSSAIVTCSDESPLSAMRHNRSEPNGLNDCCFVNDSLVNDSNSAVDVYSDKLNSDLERDNSEAMLLRAKSEPKLPPLRENDTEISDHYNDANHRTESHTDLNILSDNLTGTRRNLSEGESPLFSYKRARNPNDHHSISDRMRALASTGSSLTRRVWSYSQDSLLSETFSRDTDSCDIDAERYDHFPDEHNTPHAKQATKFSIQKFRKTLKNVGKSTSFPALSDNETAERTWRVHSDVVWINGNGKRIELEGTHLQNLSELECDALRKVARHRLEEIDLGVNVVEPKDNSRIKRKMSARKKYGLHLKEKHKDKNVDHVFGIPLIDVVENDQLLRLQKSFSPLTETPHGEFASEIIGHGDHSSLSSSSSSSCSGSTTSIHKHESGDPPAVDHHSENNLSEDETPGTQHPSTPEGDYPPVKDNLHSRLNPTVNQSRAKNASASQSLRRRGAIATDSINEIDPSQSQLLEALSRSVTFETQHTQKKIKDRSMLPPTMAQVPYVVQKCCDHIKEHGLDVTGIFRIAGSKKRVKQLREEFDRGIDVTIEEDYNPHDVAALLKEFFRDLPEALLSRELYPAFLQTAKLPKQQKLKALRCLLWLLPISNRDTLHTLLHFLAVVAAHSETSYDREGNKVPGNKMSVGNLAVIFGPNILHRYKKSQAGTEGHYQGPSLEKPEDSTAVVKVVEDLINNQLQLFKIPKHDHNEILRHLKDSNPAAVDYILRRKAAEQMRNNSRLSSPLSLSPTSPNPPSSKSISNEAMGVRAKTVGSPALSESLEEVVPLRKKAGDSFSSMPTMRISYQQALGHLTLPIGDFKEDFNQHKIDRTIPENACCHHTSEHDKERFNNCYNLNTNQQKGAMTNIITSPLQQSNVNANDGSANSSRLTVRHETTCKRKLHKQTKAIDDSTDDSLYFASNDTDELRKSSVKITEQKPNVSASNHSTNQSLIGKEKEGKSSTSLDVVSPMSKEDLNNNSFLGNSLPLKNNLNKSNNNNNLNIKETHCDTNRTIHRISSVNAENDVMYFVSASKQLPNRHKSFTKNCTTEGFNTTKLFSRAAVGSKALFSDARFPSKNSSSSFTTQTISKNKIIPSIGTSATERHHETDQRFLEFDVTFDAGTPSNAKSFADQNVKLNKISSSVNHQIFSKKQRSKNSTSHCHKPGSNLKSLTESWSPGCGNLKPDQLTESNVNDAYACRVDIGRSFSSRGLLSSSSESNSLWESETNDRSGLFETFV